MTAYDFAELAQISSRKARQALSLATDGRNWRGHILEVRTFHGRGGRSGIQYQVKVSSLPPLLQERLKALQMTDEAVSRLRLGDDTARFERAWKLETITPALEHPKGSAGRKAEIDKLHGVLKLDWTGQQRRLSKTTLYKWIETFELEGIHGLAQKVRRDKGSRKVFVSRKWMNAVPFDETTMANIHRTIKDFVGGSIKDGGQFKVVCQLAAFELRKLSAAYGFTSADESIFTIPQSFVKEESRFKAVYRHKVDRKASMDHSPRIRRSTTALAPMEVVVADVHHMNVLVARDDGTYSTPKLLAFHDIATNRVFWEIIQFENRGGVKNSHVISAFVNMCQDPAFGVPQFLYVDNGSEYGFADDLEDALHLGSKIVPFQGQEERNRIIRSIAYNASAKHVEGWFRQMNQQYFRHIQGWIDDDRMNPKRPDLGKLPAPYPADFDAFHDEVGSLVTAYEHMPQNGRSLKGKSPALAFKSHVDGGWRATIMDDRQLLTVFTRPETRVVEDHGISVRNAYWTCDELLQFHGRTVIAHIPKYHGFGALRVTDDRGNEIGIAVADQEYHVLDQSGAKESARRKKLWRQGISKLDKSVPDIDFGAKLIDFGKQHLPVVPNKPDATISIRQADTARLAIPPVAVAPDAQRKRDEELRRENELRTALFAKMNFSGRNAS